MIKRSNDFINRAEIRSKNIVSFIIINLIILSMIFNIDSVNCVQQNCSNSSLNTISEDLIVSNVNIEVNFTYNSCYIIDHNTIFKLEVTPAQLNEYILCSYIQIIYQVGSSTDYQFIKNINEIATIASPLVLNITLKSIFNGESNASGEVWFRFGYKMNGTDFGQIESTNKTNYSISIINPAPLSNDDDKFYILWFALEPEQFFLVIGVIISIIFLMIFISKKKNSQDNNKKK
ncbi:MAG: hypothetical protein GY870_04515 [archaeon]|nr:hypothetical protein [archaeon]